MNNLIRIHLYSAGHRNRSPTPMATSSKVPGHLTDLSVSVSGGALVVNRTCAPLD